MSIDIEVHVACENCRKVTAGTLSMPEGAEVPLDIADAYECGVFAHMRFVCTRCDSAIGQIVGMKFLPKGDEPAPANAPAPADLVRT